MIDLIFAAAFVIWGGLCCLLIAGVPLGWWDSSLPDRRSK